MTSHVPTTAIPTWPMQARAHFITASWIVRLRIIHRDVIHVLVFSKTEFIELHTANGFLQQDISADSNTVSFRNNVFHGIPFKKSTNILTNGVIVVETQFWVQPTNPQVPS